MCLLISKLNPITLAFCAQCQITKDHSACHGKSYAYSTLHDDGEDHINILVDKPLHRLFAAQLPSVARETSNKRYGRIWIDNHSRQPVNCRRRRLLSVTEESSSDASSHANLRLDRPLHVLHPSQQCVRESSHAYSATPSAPLPAPKGSSGHTYSTLPPTLSPRTRPEESSHSTSPSRTKAPSDHTSSLEPHFFTSLYPFLPSSFSTPNTYHCIDNTTETSSHVGRYPRPGSSVPTRPDPVIVSTGADNHIGEDPCVRYVGFSEVYTSKEEMRAGKEEESRRIVVPGRLRRRFGRRRVRK